MQQTAYIHLVPKDIAIVTEGIKWALQEDLGSDKQTFYNTLAGGEKDSVLEMAQTLLTADACMAILPS